MSRDASTSSTCESLGGCNTRRHDPRLCTGQHDTNRRTWPKMIGATTPSQQPVPERAVSSHCWAGQARPLSKAWKRTLGSEDYRLLSPLCLTSLQRNLQSESETSVAATPSPFLHRLQCRCRVSALLSVRKAPQIARQTPLPVRSPYPSKRGENTRP